MQDELREIEKELVEEVERRNLNLVTATIDASEIEGSYQEAYAYLANVNAMQQQEAKIVELLVCLE